MSCELCRQLVTLYHCTMYQDQDQCCPWHQTLGSSASRPRLVQPPGLYMDHIFDLLHCEHGPGWWTTWIQQQHNSYCFRCWSWCTSWDWCKRYIWLLVPGSLGYAFKLAFLVFYAARPDKNILVLKRPSVRVEYFMFMNVICRSWAQ